MKQFIFLYPIPEIIDFEIQNHGWSEDGGVDAFRKKYATILNACIDVRYRQKGFGINYVIFNGHQVSDAIHLQAKDRIIEVRLNFKNHITKREYPDDDYILNQLGEINTIRVAGFHMWDCVDKLAKRAFERGLDTLVDEDLTEFFSYNIKNSDFRIDAYPQNKQEDEWNKVMFMKARQGKPWLWQKY